MKQTSNLSNDIQSDEFDNLIFCIDNLTNIKKYGPY